MSNFPSVATQSSAGKIGRVGAGGAITKSKCKPKATEDLQPKKAKRDYIADFFTALEEKAPEHRDKIQCFTRIYFYFITLYADGIFNRSHKDKAWNPTKQKTTTGWNIIDTTMAFGSLSAKLLAIQAKCRSYSQCCRKNVNFFTPQVISESIAFVDDSIQMIIHEISPAAKSINPEIEQLMAAHKIPKKSALLNTDALTAFYQQHNITTNTHASADLLN